MDKYEFNIKIEQIKKLVGKGDYETAMKIADGIDWRRVRNANLLSMVAQVYEKNEEYSEAKDILLLAFERAPIGKRLLYKLADLAIKEGNIEEAEAYYKEFCDLAPDDSRQHLLRYMILKAKGAPAEQLIHSLEQYTAQELDEKWMYELAALYHEAGYGDECVRTCDKIMLMFGIGKYVDKAMNLKTQYQPLTSYQMDLVENRDKYEAKLRAVENGYEVHDEYGEGQEQPEEDEEIQDGIVEEEPVEETEEAAPSEWSAAEEADGKEISDGRPDVHEDVWGEQSRIQEEDGANDAAEQDTPVTSIDQVLAARMKEAEQQEKLAKEMANLADGSFAEEHPAEQTRILTDIKNVIPMPERKWANDDAKEAAMETTAAAEEETAVDGDEDVVIEELWDEDEETTPNHLMIEAKTPEEGLEMALDALKKIHKETGTRQVIAKITGSKLNKKGIFAVADKILGKDLVIEEAGDLSKSVLNELNAFMERDETGVVVVLIDNPRQLEELHMKNPELAEKFECIGCQEEVPEDDINEVAAAVKRQAEKEEELAQAAVVRPEAPVKAKQEDEPVKTRQAAEVPEEPYDDEEYEEEPEEEPKKPVKAKKGFFGRRSKKEEYDEEEYEDDYDDGEDNEEEYQDEAQNDSDYEENYGKPEVPEKEMDIDEFAEYACKYAGDIDCSITGKSMLALYERIEIMEEEGIPLTRKNAEDLIEEAADKAEKPSLGKLIKGVFSPKYNKDGLLILKEEHFI